MARDDLDSTPPLVPPPGLRRYVGFTRLSAAAVQAVARVLDRDDEYRSHVASAVDESSVGRAAWLWLTRPEGWREEFDELQAAAEASAAAASDEREERDARRQLAAARAAADRATADAAARAQEAADIRAHLVEEQAHRRLLQKHVDRMEAQLQQARDERAAAVHRLKDAEAKLTRRAAEAKEAVARLRELEAAPPPGDEPPGSPAAPPVELVEALGTAASRAAELADSLHRLHQMIVGGHRADGPPERGEDEARRSAEADETDRTDRTDRTRGTVEADETAQAPDAGATGASARRPVGPPAALPRTPLALPGGVRDDSVEAVDLLLRAPGAWLLVDGYNVSMVGWPDLSVAEQRRRLVVVLGEIAARTGASVKVVFDGAATEPWPIPQPGRRLVSVAFSPADVEADDVLLDLVDRLPTTRPVIVASSDNRVREGARRLGANLVHARQLLGALRR